VEKEKFQEAVLQQLQILINGQRNLEKGQQDIKNQLKYMWEDIRKLDNRLINIEDRMDKQEQETAYLKRLK
jgi:hypothetical protein